MTWLVALIGAGVLLALVLAFVVLLRSSKPTLTWQRVQTEAERIQREADDLQKLVAEQAEKDKREVRNASGSGLADLVRRRMFGK